MYSLKDITNGCVKIEIPENPHCKEIISACEMPVVKVEISESACSTVNHQTISLPQDSIYEVPATEEVDIREDVLNIQISNVQGALPDQIADKNAMPVYQTENHVDKPNGHAEVHSPAIDDGNQEDLPPDEGVQNGKLSNSVASREKTSPNMSPKMSPMESEERSPGHDSPVYNGEASAETAHQDKEVSFQSGSPERASSYRTSHRSDTLPGKSQYMTYQLGSNGTKAAYLFTTPGKLSPYQNGTSESSPSNHALEPISTPLSSSATVPLYHMEETPTSQNGYWKKNENYQISYYNGMPMYYGDYSLLDLQQGIPFWPTESRDLVSNNQKRTQNCNCCCHAQNDFTRYPDLKSQRPSVIMVPVNWNSSNSGISHLPLKQVDNANYKMHSQTRDVPMDYSDDSDSSDDDENGKREKYFRKNIDGTTARFKLTKEDWARIPINTFPSGGRLLSGDWTRIFLSKVKESNPWCSLRFKNNHVRSENSRKIHSAVFFRGGAECKRPECSVKVRFVIRKERGKHVEVTYLGNICHSSQPGGGEISSEAKKMKRARRTYST